MNQKEINSMNMVNGTMTFMDNHNAVWSGEADIVESVDYIKTRVEKLNDQAQQRMGQDTKGVTDEMDVAIDKAVPLAFLMGKRIKLFARKTGNLVLSHEVDYSMTELRHGKFEEIKERMKMIAKRGFDHLADLKPFKVKQEDVDKLNGLIAAFETKPAERKSVTGEGIESTAAIKQLLREVLLKLNDEMDDEVEALIDDEEFVGGYFAVRRTDDRRGRGKAKDVPVVPGS